MTDKELYAVLELGSHMAFTLWPAYRAWNTVGNARWQELFSKFSNFAQSNDALAETVTAAVIREDTGPSAPVTVDNTAFASFD